MKTEPVGLIMTFESPQTLPPEVTFEDGSFTQETLKDYVLFESLSCVYFVRKTKVKEFKIKHPNNRSYFGDVSLIRTTATFGTSNDSSVMLNFKYNFPNFTHFLDRPATLKINFEDHRDGSTLDYKNSIYKQSFIATPNYGMWSYSIALNGSYAEYKIFTDPLDSSSFFIRNGSTDLQASAELQSIVWNKSFYTSWITPELKLPNPDKDVYWHVFTMGTNDDDEEEEQSQAILTNPSDDFIVIPSLKITLSYSSSNSDESGHAWAGAKIENIEILGTSNLSDAWQPFDIYYNVINLNLKGLIDKDNQSVQPSHTAWPRLWLRTSQEKAKASKNSCKKGCFWYIDVTDQYINNYFNFDDGGTLSRATFHDKFRYALPYDGVEKFSETMNQFVEENFGGFDVPLELNNFLDWQYGDEGKQKRLDIYVHSKEDL